MGTVIVVVVCLLGIYWALAPLLNEPCPLCEGRDTEYVHLIYPVGGKSYVCHDCHVWFSKKIPNNP